MGVQSDGGEEVAGPVGGAVPVGGAGLGSHSKQVAAQDTKPLH